MMSSKKKKVAGFIAIITGLVVMVGGYFLFRPKQQDNAGGAGNSGTGDSGTGNSGNGSGNGNTPAPGPVHKLSAGDKLIAVRYANIYRDKVLSSASLIGSISGGNTIGAFILQEGDWIYVSKLPSGAYPDNTPQYFYLYKSAEYSITPF